MRYLGYHFACHWNGSVRKSCSPIGAEFWWVERTPRQINGLPAHSVAWFIFLTGNGQNSLILIRRERICIKTPTEIIAGGDAAVGGKPFPCVPVCLSAQPRQIAPKTSSGESDALRFAPEGLAGDTVEGSEPKIQWPICLQARVCGASYERETEYGSARIRDGRTGRERWNGQSKEDYEGLQENPS